ncbi:putative cysteine-rich DPF motif domain-containing protein 1, partial [Apostichopus japonicus]
MSEFCCALCSFSSRYDYFGRKPPFVESIVLMEKAYVLKNPFTPHDSHLTIGAHCSQCDKAVCVQQTCSVFYTRRFCKHCVEKHSEEFPQEISE